MTEEKRKKGMSPELRKTIMQLSVEDQRDIFAFAFRMLEMRQAGEKPITSKEWERLTPRQRREIYIRARWYVFVNNRSKPKRV